MMKELKKWNWGAFVFVLVLSLLSTLANENNTTADAIFGGLAIGTLLGLIFAYMGKD